MTGNQWFKGAMGILFALAASGMSHGAAADAVRVANELRRHQCASQPGLRVLRNDPHLEAIAERWSHGGRLASAIAQGYGEVQFVSLHVSGARSDVLLSRALRGQFCQSLGNPTFARIGIFRRDDEYWFVLASAATGPRPRDATAVRDEVLRRVNEARATARRCGAQTFGAAAALRLNDMLNRAAEAHAHAMANHQTLQHEGFDGSTPGDRARAAGYSWHAVGENIAAGPRTAAEVVQMWLDSPGHCMNIMSAKFTEMGVAFTEDRENESGTYWAQEFGAPR